MESSVNSISSSSTTTTTPPTTTPASSFVNLLLNEINNQDIHGLLDVQRSLLEQLDKTNEKLDGINKFSAKRYLDAQRDFSSHTQLLTTMKSDLDLIFKRIKLLKMRLSKKYPAAYTSVIRMNSTQNNPLDEDDSINDLSTSVKSVASPSLVKSKTIDYSQIPPLMRESYSSVQLTNNNTEQTENSFDGVGHSVPDKSSNEQEFSTLFKECNDELINNQTQKSSEDNNE